MSHPPIRVRRCLPPLLQTQFLFTTTARAGIANLKPTRPYRCQMYDVFILTGERVHRLCCVRCTRGSRDRYDPDASAYHGGGLYYTPLFRQ